MRAIWKYKLDIGTYQYVFPFGSIIRYIGEQGGELYVWVEVSPKETNKEIVSLKVVGTGWDDIGPNDVYIGTAQISDFVWHVYETI